MVEKITKRARAHTHTEAERERERERDEHTHTHTHTSSIRLDMRDWLSSALKLVMGKGDRRKRKLKERSVPYTDNRESSSLIGICKSSDETGNS